MSRMEERVKLVKAMEFLAWHLNDETIFEDWLALGVADGDVEAGDLSSDPDPVLDYTDNQSMSELMGLFLRLMARGLKSGGLYCDGVVSRGVGEPSYHD